MKFSVITINYNNAAGLEKTILSVINQDYDDFEYIVIDGGSTDGSVEIIKKYSDRIAYWVSEPDKGIYHAMNKGVTHANGEYVNFMNSGDCFHSNTVLRDVSSYGHTEDIITGTTVISGTNKPWFNMPEKMTALFLFRDTIGHQASFIRTSLQRELPYDESLKIVADWDFFFKAIVMKNCTFTYDKIVVCDYDLTGISIQEKEEREKERLMVLNRLLPKKITDDYDRFMYFDDKTIFKVGRILKTYRINKIFQCLTNILSKIITNQHL